MPLTPFTASTLQFYNKVKPIKEKFSLLLSMQEDAKNPKHSEEEKEVEDEFESIEKRLWFMEGVFLNDKLQEINLER